MNQYKLVRYFFLIYILIEIKFLDSPTNCNYISIFTRKSTIKKKKVSIIQNSDNWKMLKIEAKNLSIRKQRDSFFFLG